MSADGKRLVSRAGAVLLWEAMRVGGLVGACRRGPPGGRVPRAGDDPGKVVADLAAAVALGGDWLAGVAVLGAQPVPAGAELVVQPGG